MSVVADTLTAGAPDCTCDCADVSAVKPQRINTLQQNKKKNASMCRQILKQLRNFGMDTDNNLVQVKEKNQTSSAVGSRNRRGCHNTEGS